MPFSFLVFIKKAMFVTKLLILWIFKRQIKHLKYLFFCYENIPHINHYKAVNCIPFIMRGCLTSTYKILQKVLGHYPLPKVEGSSFGVVQPPIHPSVRHTFCAGNISWNFSGGYISMRQALHASWRSWVQAQITS